MSSSSFSTHGPLVLGPVSLSPWKNFDKAWTFTLGVINIGDAAPPYANYASSANNFVGGYDLSYGDPRGRFVYGRVAYKFR